MSCRSCGSGSLKNFAGELSVHALGMQNVDAPVVWVFPELQVCMDCGFTELKIDANKLGLLGKGPPGDGEAAE
jgi:hypothetical protein